MIYDPHKIYDFLANSDVKFHKTLKFGKKWYSNINLLTSFFDLLTFYLGCWSQPKTVHLIREFQNKQALFYMLPSIIFGVKIILIINHNFNYLRSSIVVNFLLKKNLLNNTKFLLFHGDFQLLSSQHKFNNILDRHIMSLPFPMNSNADIESPRPVTLGLMMPKRKEQGSYDDYLSALNKLDPLDNIVAMLGNSFKNLTSTKIETFDTSSEHGYRNALKSCKYLLLTYDEHYYAFRSSGVLHDALQYGAIPIVPDLPVLRNQTRSGIYGLFYSRGLGLQQIIDVALELTNEDVRNYDFNDLYRTQSREQILAMFDCQLNNFKGNENVENWSHNTKR